MNSLLTTANAIWTDEQRRVVPIVLASLTVAIVFAFWNAFQNLWFRWGESQELSHSYFLPLISGWMLWERRDALLKSVGAPQILGLVPTGVSLFFLVVGELINVPLVAQGGFVLLLMSLTYLFGGRSLFVITLIPLAYLLFMIPPPYWAITVMSWNFQLMSSELGVALIRLFDIPVFLSGNVIHLPSAKLEVVEACSGLRYLFPFLSLGALAAYFYKGPLWHRLAIFLSTIPITILMNSFRIAMTGILIETVGGNHTDGFTHMFEGYMVFILCIAFLMLVIWGFTLMRGQKGPLAFVGFDDVAPVTPDAPWTREAFVRNGIIATVMVMLAGIVAHTADQRPTVIPDRQDFATVPLEFPEWRTRETTLDRGIADVLGADDYIITDMIGPEGQNINLYMAYLEERRDGKAWHSPMQCLPGGGWEIASHTIEPVERVDGSGTYHHNRMIIRQGDIQYLLYYWYDQRGRKIANEFAMKLVVMWDDLVQRRSDGAMVRLMTQIQAGESVEDAEARLDTMRQNLEPLLPKYIPQ